MEGFIMRVVWSFQDAHWSLKNYSGYVSLFQISCTVKIRFYPQDQPRVSVHMFFSLILVLIL